MTSENLAKLINTADLSRSRNLGINNGVYYRYVIEKDDYFVHDLVVFTNETMTERYGGITFVGEVDIDVLMFDNYTNRKIVSNFMRSGWIKRLHPNLKSASIYHKEGTTEYNISKHLLGLAKLKLSKESKIAYFNKREYRYL